MGAFLVLELHDGVEMLAELLATPFLKKTRQKSLANRSTVLQ